MHKPIVLVVIQHYLPGTKTGGPVRTIANLVEHLGDDFEFRILTRDRDQGDDNPYTDVRIGEWERTGKAWTYYLSGEMLSPWRLKRLLDNITYDVLYINGVFPSMSLLMILLKNLRMLKKASVLLAPRGHLEPGALSIKPRKKRLFLTMSKTLGLFDGLSWHATSASEEQDILREFRGRIKQIRVIPNLTRTETPLLHSETLSKTSGYLKLVFLSRVSRKKNLSYALDLLAEINGAVELDIFGPIEDTVYWRECGAKAEALPPNIRVTYRGTLAPQDVASRLNQYHLMILPTLGENFGHVVLEAMSAGCPVLISDRTPWNEVQQHGAGWAIPLEDPHQFQTTIQHIIDADANTHEAYRTNARVYAEAYQSTSNAADEMRRFLIELASAPAMRDSNKSRSLKDKSTDSA